jgi:hypothetical protein
LQRNHFSQCSTPTTGSHGNRPSSQGRGPDSGRPRPALAIKKRYKDRTGWSHPPASPLLGWVKTAGPSPIAYLQPGHGPTAYANPNVRRLLANAIRWVASPAAHEWARQNQVPVG